MMLRNLDTARLCAAAVVLVAGFSLAEPVAQAANSVVVQSMSVSPGAAGVSVGVLVSNDDVLDLVAVPLEIRTIDGAFVSGTFTLAPQGRIETGVLDNRILYYYADPDASNSCSGPTSSTWSSGSGSPSANGSPDAVLWVGLRMLGASLPPGFDADVPSLKFTLDIDTVQGSFEIDTMCVFPTLQHLQFSDDVGADVPVAFTKGVITVAATGNLCPVSVAADVDPVEVAVGDVATNQITADDLEGDPIEYFLVSGPGVVDQMSGEWTWTPDCLDEGVFAVEIEASDRGAGGCSSSVALFIVIVDVAPMATDCGGGVTVPWGQTATQEIVASGGCPPYWFELLSGPGVIDHNLGMWMFPTTCSNAGHTYMVEVEVYDYHERNSVCTLYVEVINSPLTCSPLSAQDFPYGVSVSVVLGPAVDGDGQPLTYGITEGTGWPGEAIVGNTFEATRPFGDTHAYFVEYDVTDGCAYTSCLFTISEPSRIDSVIVVSKKVALAETSIDIRVRIVNPTTELWQLKVPLEVRAGGAGSFITSIDMSYADRMSDPGVLWWRDAYRVEDPTEPACDVSAPHPAYNSLYRDPLLGLPPQPVAASPEGLFFEASGWAREELTASTARYASSEMLVATPTVASGGPTLLPGSDTDGSLVITVDHNGSPGGSFGIVQTCIQPYGTLEFGDGDFAYVPHFVPGVITINSPPVSWDSCVELYSGSAVSVQLPAYDADDPASALSYTLVQPPSEGTTISFNPATGVYEYEAPGGELTDSIMFSVTDGYDASATHRFCFDVAAATPDTFWVDSVNGDNGYVGSELFPFRTITHAMTMTSPNLIIMVGPGTYAELTIRFPPRQSVKLVSTDGPFATHLTGESTDGLGPILVMDAKSDAVIHILDGFTIRDNEVTDSLCTECVGGVQVVSPTTAHIVNNIISGNVGFMAGGIEYAGGGGGLVANNWIVHNRSKYFPIPRDVSTQGRPGGVSIPSTGGVHFLNNTVAENGGLNDVEVAGVWVSMELSLSVFDNNIVAFNQPGVGFQTDLDITTLPMYNCLYFGNGDANSVPDGVGSAIAWLYHGDSLFRDTANGDYRLSCFSPARDSGRTATLDELPAELDSLLMKLIDGKLTRADIDRQRRPFSNTAVDIGADEFYDDAKIAAFAPSPSSGCAPLDVVFTNESQCFDEQWFWDFGDGNGSVNKSPLHTYDTAGVYRVRLVALGDLDADTTYDTVRVSVPFTAGFEADQVEGCVGMAVTFTPSATAAVEGYHWDFGDGDTSNLPEPIHIYDHDEAVMHYDVTLTLTNVCDTVTVFRPDYIKVLGKPTASITSSLDDVTDPICAPYEVHFEFADTSESFDSVRWDFGDNTRSTVRFPDHTYLEGKTYSVLFTGYGDCDSVRVVRSPFFTFLQRPTAVLNARTSNVDTLFCCVDVDTARLTADITGETDEPEWLLGDGIHLFGTSVEHVYSTIDRYLPKVILTHDCGTDTIPIGDTLVVGTQPVADFTVEADSVYQPDPIVFIDQSLNNPREWLWTFGDGDTSIVPSPQHVYEPGTYHVSLYVANSCGSDAAPDQTVRVGGFLPLIVDSLDAQGDTIFYSVQVDALVLAYDNPVYFSGHLTPTPRRGSMSFAFSQSSAVPPYSAVMRAIRSSDLSTGLYTIVLAATDSLRLNPDQTPFTKQATRPLDYKAAAFLTIDPSPMAMGKTTIGNRISKDLVLTNTADHDTVLVQEPLIDGSYFEVVFGSGGTLAPGVTTRWTVQFTPTRKGDFTARVRVRSNDPAQGDSLVPVTAKVVTELHPPRVMIIQPGTGQDLRIDKPLEFEFNEGMIVAPLDTILVVRSARTGADIPGNGAFTDGRHVSFVPDAWLTPDDTLAVQFRSCVTDSSFNYLDGNSDGFEQGTPDDDFLADVPTGPGVYPGDTDNDGTVNERDILPLGRFLGRSGDGRDDDGSVFALQPATAWIPREATYADADGDGDVDSMDICPIADFFDTDVDLAKLTLEGWLAAAEQWSGDVVDQLIAGLEYCNGQGEGHAALREILLQMRQATPRPTDYALNQNYPNPFNPTTVIAYTLQDDGEVRLEVFDVRGRRVVVLDSGFKTAGRHWKVWDGRDDDGRPVASGVYFYRLETREFRFARKMVLLK